MTIIESSYYEKTFELTDNDLETALELYQDYCTDNNLEAESTDIDDLKNGMLDHVLYHIEDKENQLDFDIN